MRCEHPRPASRMPIGIDARAAAEVPAGRGRVVRELLRALAAREDDGRRYVLYARERVGARRRSTSASAGA